MALETWPAMLRTASCHRCRRILEHPSSVLFSICVSAESLTCQPHSLYMSVSVTSPDRKTTNSNQNESRGLRCTAALLKNQLRAQKPVRKAGHTENWFQKHPSWSCLHPKTREAALTLSEAVTDLSSWGLQPLPSLVLINISQVSGLVPGAGPHGEGERLAPGWGSPGEISRWL